MQKFYHTVLLIFVMVLANNAFASNISDWKLSSDGLGPIHVGMTIKQAQKASGIKFNPVKLDKEQIESCSCYYVSLKGTENLLFMIADNKIVRINVNSAQFYTTRGAKIGDTETKVLALYDGKLSVEPHHYYTNGNYLTLIQKKQDHAIRFETNGDKITLIYSGINEYVHQIEDCV